METSNDFAKAVRAVLEEHGLSFRGQRVRTGLSHVTVMNMAQGVIPEMQTVARFAQGFGLDANEWLKLAGYPPLAVNNPTLPSAMLEIVRRVLAENGREDMLEELEVGGLLPGATLEAFEGAFRVGLAELLDMEKGETE